MQYAIPPEGIAPQNVTQDASTGMRAEVFELATGAVWLCQQAMTEAEFAALEPAPGFIKVGIGRSAMDVAWFRRSPGAAADGPLETRAMGGRTFARVAKPLDFRGFNPGTQATLFQVEKHHVLGYHAGKTLQLVRMPDGQFLVPQTLSAQGDCKGVPPGGEFVEVTLQTPWSVVLPCPTSVYFFNDLSSFCGPIPQDQLPPEARA
jgi:hypothetical protein